MFLLLHLIFCSITYFLCHDGKGENSGHRLSLASCPAPPPSQHQWAAGCLFWRLDLISFTFFANVSFTTSDIFFNNILSVPSWETWKLSPPTEFGLPPHTTTLPTPMGRGMFILKVRFKFLHLFRSCFFLYIDICFNKTLSVPWWERWKLSPRTECGLLLPSQPCQHWEATAGMFWGLVVSSFSFFAHVFYCIWFLF